MPRPARDAVIPLRKLSFDLLRVLVENAPNVVQHEQLASQVWGPRRVVTPENLAKCVMLLRQALHDRAAHSRYIEDDTLLYGGPLGLYRIAASGGGETHVYVTSFPDLGDTVRISTAQGTDPQWRSDGRELYCVTLDRTLMAVKVRAGARLELGLPVPLFHVPLEPRWLAFGSAYAPAPDGERFIAAVLGISRTSMRDVGICKCGWSANKAAASS